MNCPYAMSGQHDQENSEDIMMVCSESFPLMLMLYLI